MRRKDKTGTVEHPNLYVLFATIKQDVNPCLLICREQDDSLLLYIIITRIMEIASLIIAVSSLLFGLFIYLKHDKALKAQQKFINEYEIKKIRRENEELSKADVRAYMKNRRPGSCSGILVIKNHGKAPAHNIHMHYIPRRLYTDLPLDIQELLPEAEQEFPIRLGFGNLIISVRLTWTDASGFQECQCPLL